MYPLILLLACSPTELTPVASNTCAPGVWVDEDGDGASPCAALAARRDCDDRDPTTRPEAPERCDGLDDDCDGRVPDAELDLDGDGEPLCAGDCDDARADLQHADLDGDGYGTCDGDVDDDDDGVFPGGPELCNGRDDDGDGVVPPTEFDRDGDGDLACATDACAVATFCE